MAKGSSSQQPSDVLIIQRVKSIAKDSGRIIPSPKHAKQRMKQRSIPWVQVVRILSGNFLIHEAPHKDARGDWRLTVEGKDLDSNTGGYIRVGVALKQDNRGEYLLVLTVIRPSIRRK